MVLSQVSHSRPNKLVEISHQYIPHSREICWGILAPKNIAAGDTAHGRERHHGGYYNTLLAWIADLVGCIREGSGTVGLDLSTIAIVGSQRSFWYLRICLCAKDSEKCPKVSDAGGLDIKHEE